MLKKLLVSFIFITVLSYSSKAQTYNLNSNLGTITTCSGNFRDGAGTYSNNSNYTVTFCSGSTANIVVDFSSFETEDGYDFLNVYDGNSTASPQIDAITGNQGSFIIGSSGSCLTFEFISDGSFTDPGWAATISCVTPCTPPTAVGVSTNQVSPIKVCINESIDFDGSGSSAAGGFTITNYTWDFDDGNTATGVTSSHSYAAPGEYVVQLDVEDDNNCHNTALIDLVVQVGTEPTFVGTTPDQTVCVGENVCLDGVVNPTPWQDVPSTTVAGTTTLPDGSGVCYNAPLTFTEFGPGVTITSAADVVDIFANMEHTWAGDLTIDLVCPNGQEVGLFNADGTWNTPNISSENFGNPATPIGYDYSWTSTGQTMDAWAGANGAATTIPAGTYGSEEPYSGLIGCPLNGTWQLKICDTHSIDDGTVFSWGINFDPSLYATLSGFTPVFNSNCAGTSWTGTNGASNGAITGTSGDCNQVCVTPPSPGNYSYTFTGTDDFGCSFDTTITITATAGAVADAGNDISYCSGASGTIGVAPVGGITYSWSPTTGLSNSNAANPTVTLTNGTGSPVTTTYILTASAGSCSTTDTVDVTVNPQPTAGFAQPLAQCLTGNSFTFNNTGTTGATYDWDFGDTGTSTAENPTHTYATANTFTVTQIVSFGGCADTATLNVVVNPMPVPTATADSVNCNGDATGSATVTGVTNSPGGFNYSWDSAPVQNTQTATGLPQGTYTVTVTDQNTTCQGQTTVTVFEPPALSATETHVDPTCAQGANGTATANPTGGTAGYIYSWNTTPVQTTQTATGLTAGTYTCTVTDYNNCTFDISATLTDPAGMVLSTSMNQANCGASDGDATVTVTSGGSGNFGYSWNTAPVQNTQTATGIPSGTYIATVTDITAGCVSMDTIFVSTTVGLTATATFISDALCNGSSDGLAYAFPTGGTPTYSYLWDDPLAQTNDTITAAAGTYNVTITDGSNCTGTAQVTIGEPTVVVASITASQDETCLGANNGTATLGGAGGSNNFTYSWNTVPVQNTQTATGLAPSTYWGYVYDDNMCVDSIQVTINPGPLMTVSHTYTDVSCFNGTNGSIDVTVNGAPGAITYNWMPGAIASEDPVGLGAGTYYLTATSGGCQVLDTVTISEPTQVIAVVDSSFDVICNGGSDGLAYGAASGGTGGVYTYSWNTTPVQNTATATGLPQGTYTLTVTDSNLCQATVNVNINEPAPLNANTGSIDAYCGVDQGSVWASPTNGVAPYTYIWDSLGTVIGGTDTINGLYPGTYHLQVIDDNGCKFIDDITVNAAPGGTVSISNSTNVSCNGDADGTATVSASNAFPGYTYLWDAAAGNQTTNPAVGLAFGTYGVTVTDTFGCVMTTTVNITQPNPLTVTLTGYDKMCYNACDANAEAVPSGGNSSYNWLWNDPSGQITQIATGLCPGMVGVTITDSKGCTVSDSVLITNPAQMTLSNTTSSASCNQADGGATVSVTANGIAPYTYEWSDGTSVISALDNLTGVVAGTYYATVTDSLGCVVSDTVTIPNASGPQIDSTDFVDVLCFGGNNGSATVYVSGGAFPYIYSWDDPANQSTPTATNLIAGSYIVNITDTNGCNISTAINISEPDELLLTSGGLNPTCTGDTNGYVWVNAQGGVMPYTYTWDDALTQSTDTATNLGALVGGYTVVVTDTNGCFKTENVVLTDPALFTISVTGTDVSCFGGNDGSAVVSETNGFGPFQYIWDDPSNQTTQSVTGLVANTYNVTATDDDGCMANGSIVINEPLELIITQDTVINVSCNGFTDGSAAVNVVGGSGAYSFTWDLGGTIIDTLQNPTGLAAGSYLVTVTDTNGCNDQIIIDVTEPTPLAANFNTSDVLCANGNSGFAYVTASGGTLPYSYQWDAGAALQQTDTAFNLVAGTYSVDVTDSNGCLVPLTNIVIGQPDTLALSTSTVSSTCGSNNGSAIVNVGGGSPPFNFAWNTTPVQATAIADSLFAGSYTVVITDFNGCQDSITANVTDLGSPVVTIPTSTNVSCNGAADGSATANVTGGATPYTYEWNTTPVQNTPTATGLDALTYSVTVTDSNGCIASEDVTIQQANALVAVIGTPTHVSCNGGNDGFASVQIAGGIAPFTYLWDDGLAQTTDSATALTAGDYIVQVSDSNNCLAFDTVTITEPQVLTVTLDSLKDANCFGFNDGYINVIANGGTLPYVSYAWTPNVSSGPTANGLVAGNYSVTITDNNGCTVTDNYDVEEPDVLAITTDSTDSNCGSDNGSVSVTSTTGGTSPYTYSWNDPANQTTASATGLFANTYTVLVADDLGCTISADVTVIDNPGPTIDSVTTVDPLCNGDNNGSAQVYASGNGPFTYSWTPSGQTTDVANGLTAGVYSVVVTDINSCDINVGGITLNEPLPLTADINMPSTACYGQPIQFFGVGGGGTPFGVPQDPYDVIWLAPFNTTGEGPFYDTITTNFTYNIVIQDANGCIQPHSEDIAVGAPLDISATGDLVCLGDTASISASASGGLLGSTYEYTWLVYDSLTGNTTTPAGVVNPSTSPTTNVYANDTTDYIVYVSDGCSRNDTVGLVVQVKDTAIVTFNTSNDGCPYPTWSVGFEVMNDNWNSTFYWDIDGDGSSDLTTQNDSTSYAYSISGTYDVGLTVVTENGCSSSFLAIDEVTIYPVPIADFMSDPETVTMLNPIYDFSDLSSPDVSSWNWDFGDLTTDLINQNPSHTYQDTGFYTVTLIASNGLCEDTITKNVVVKPDFLFLIPNTFTPQADGINDIFRPGTMIGVAENDYSFLIFDRWGEKIFEGHELSDGWDGTVKGSSEPAQTGVYVWMIKLKGIDGLSREYTGHVNLLK